MTSIQHTIETTSDAAATISALTTGEGLRGWWSRDCDISEGVGGENVLRFTKGERKVTMRFRVDAIESDKVAWTCVDNANPIWPGTTLEWRLSKGAEGTTIAFEHTGFAESPAPPLYEMTQQGWQHFVGSLKAYLDKGEGQPW